eukprot:TRINITY_DN18568_c5_g1_i1.p1 TRINITY_DN18568_c5_g1~~TRINITY_DN18568_c5_g1_i1.p1  ORF type:complete len:354 (-),score=69.56 TRINITY_DN18568_c5_g1_i1:149-1162(-)
MASNCGNKGEQCWLMNTCCSMKTASSLTQDADSDDGPPRETLVIKRKRKILPPVARQSDLYNAGSPPLPVVQLVLPVKLPKHSRPSRPNNFKRKVLALLDPRRSTIGMRRGLMRCEVPKRESKMILLNPLVSKIWRRRRVQLIESKQLADTLSVETLSPKFAPRREAPSLLRPQMCSISSRRRSELTARLRNVLEGHLFPGIVGQVLELLGPDNSAASLSFSSTQMRKVVLGELEPLCSQHRQKKVQHAKKRQSKQKEIVAEEASEVLLPQKDNVCAVKSKVANLSGEAAVHVDAILEAEATKDDSDASIVNSVQELLRTRPGEALNSYDLERKQDE